MDQPAIQYVEMELSLRLSEGKSKNSVMTTIQLLEMAALDVKLKLDGSVRDIQKVLAMKLVETT